MILAIHYFIRFVRAGSISRLRCIEKIRPYDKYRYCDFLNLFESLRFQIAY